MSMQGFHIESLLRFNPPRYVCEKCYALLLRAPHDWKTQGLTCPVCGVEYLPTRDFAAPEVGEYLTRLGLRIEFDDLITHSRALAGIAHKARSFSASSDRQRPPYPPIQALFQALRNEAQFVHFSTFGIGDMMLGAIKTVAQQVRVAGIVAGANKKMVEELTKYRNEAPWLIVKLFEREKWEEEATHHKIIVIDGLLAFTGSANLRVSAWRKAETGREHIEIVTDLEKVVRLNNDYFSTVWAEFRDYQQIEMWEIPPWERPGP